MFDSHGKRRPERNESDSHQAGIYTERNALAHTCTTAYKSGSIRSGTIHFRKHRVRTRSVPAAVKYITGMIKVIIYRPCG